jgi:hypothetical protein
MNFNQVIQINQLEKTVSRVPEKVNCIYWSRVEKTVEK